MGAKAGRVVRVLRLVRILKLYKAYYDARQEARRRERERAQLQQSGKPGEEDDWDDADLEEGHHEAKLEEESRVGRRLSDMTTRRTICLILAMLLVLPQLQAEVQDQTPASSEFGADHVYASFQEYLSASTAKAHARYERTLLQYIYYHNWFALANMVEFCPVYAGCPAVYYGHLFWVGIVGQNQTGVLAMAAEADVKPTTADGWESSYTGDNIYNYGTMPEEAKTILGSPWTESCDRGVYYMRGISLLAHEVPYTLSHTIRCPDELRYTESLGFSPRLLTDHQYSDWHFSFFFDLRPFLQMESIFGLSITAAVLVLLVLGSLWFSHDANRLVLNPVEKMIARVKLIRDNPICAMQMADEEFKAEELAKAKKKRKRAICKELLACEWMNDKYAAPMETVILEKSIIKLGSLLALGFGEAGANIISQNMKGDGSAGVNAMVPGRSVECVIGVARVQDFSTATEVLQSKIMTFVNQIAEIVHGVVNEHYGAPNKNNGDMFLVIWRIESASDLKARRLAELSVLAFSKILGSLHRSPLLADYRTHPGLQYRLGSNCRVNLTFGLHAGWAIEGAVGTEYKIEASYLSPNVSIATNVEHATRLYGVSFIVARSVVDLCSRDMMSKFRLIDHVVIRGSKTPMELYCVDLDYSSVTVDESEPLQVVWNTRNRFKARQFLESAKNNKMQKSYDAAKGFDDDPAITAMRKRYTEEFFQLFNMGYQNYSQGEWQVAQHMLSCTKVLLNVEDGPSLALLRFMDVYKFQAPKEWQGIREMDASDH